MLRQSDWERTPVSKVKTNAKPGPVREIREPTPAGEIQENGKAHARGALLANLKQRARMETAAPHRYRCKLDCGAEATKGLCVCVCVFFSSTTFLSAKSVSGPCRNHLCGSASGMRT